MKSGAINFDGATVFRGARARVRSRAIRFRCSGLNLAVTSAGDRKSALVRYGLVAIALMNVGVELIKMYFGTSARGVEGRYGRVRAAVASVNHRTSSLERTMPRADALAPEVEETRAETAAATTTPANVRRERESAVRPPSMATRT